MRLWLMRHGEAQSQARTDAERQLTQRGRAEVLLAAGQLQGRPLQHILVSPYVRAQQTAAIVREALSFAGELQTVPWLTPDDEPETVLAQLAPFEGREVLLVTHQPLVGALGGWLVHGNRQQPIPMQTASLAELEGEFLLAGGFSLRALVHANH